MKLVCVVIVLCVAVAVLANEQTTSKHNLGRVYLARAGAEAEKAALQMENLEGNVQRIRGEFGVLSRDLLLVKQQKPASAAAAEPKTNNEQQTTTATTTTTTNNEQQQQQQPKTEIEKISEEIKQIREDVLLDSHLKSILIEQKEKKQQQLLRKDRLSDRNEFDAWLQVQQDDDESVGGEGTFENENSRNLERKIFPVSNAGTVEGESVNLPVAVGQNEAVVAKLDQSQEQSEDKDVVCVCKRSQAAPRGFDRVRCKRHPTTVTETPKPQSDQIKQCVEGRWLRGQTKDDLCVYFPAIPEEQKQDKVEEIQLPPECYDGRNEFVTEGVFQQQPTKPQHHQHFQAFLQVGFEPCGC